MCAQQMRTAQCSLKTLLQGMGKYSLAGKIFMGSSFKELGELSKRIICTDYISWNNRGQRLGMVERQERSGGGGARL